MLLFVVLLFYGVKQKDSNKSIQTKEAQSWFSKGKQLYPFGISWFDPLDRTIVRSGGSNHGSILFLTCPVVFVRDPTIISLNPFSSFFILFHPFSSLFFKKKKRAEKGRDRSDIMVFLRKTIISRRDIMRKGKVS